MTELGVLLGACGRSAAPRGVWGWHLEVHLEGVQWQKLMRAVASEQREKELGLSRQEETLVRHENGFDHLQKRE